MELWRCASLILSPKDQGCSIPLSSALYHTTYSNPRMVADNLSWLKLWYVLFLVLLGSWRISLFSFRCGFVVFLKVDVKLFLCNSINCSTASYNHKHLWSCLDSNHQSDADKSLGYILVRPQISNSTKIPTKLQQSVILSNFAKVGVFNSRLEGHAHKMKVGKNASHFRGSSRKTLPGWDSFRK